MKDHERMLEAKLTSFTELKRELWQVDSQKEKTPETTFYAENSNNQNIISRRSLS